MSRGQTIPAVIFLLLLGSSMPFNALSQNSETENLQWLKVKGRWIVDEDGNSVLLRGADYMGMEFGWFYHSEEDFSRMKSGVSMLLDFQ